MNENLKLARVADADSTQVGMLGAEIGEWVVVPAHFPNEVRVMTTRRGHFARSDGWGGEEFETFPERTPEAAWREWKENQ